MPGWRVRSVSFSLSKNLAAVEWCKKTMALELFEETLIFQKFAKDDLGLEFGMDQAFFYIGSEMHVI